MKRALVLVPALFLCGLCRPAQALPVAQSRPAVALPAASPVVPARYRRHHYRRDGAAPDATADTGAVRPGQWQFAAQLQAPAPQQGSGQAPPVSGGGGLQTTFTGCISAQNPVPVQVGPQCHYDRSERDGARVSWTMTCSNGQATVHSDGTAQYHADTMDATMTSHLPGAGGAAVDITQYITGRYLGPCMQQAAMPVIPPAAQATGSSAPARPQGASQQAPPTAAAAPQPATPATQLAPSAAETTAQAAPAEQERLHHPRYARHWRHHRYRRHYAVRYYGGGAAFPWPLSILFGR